MEKKNYQAGSGFDKSKYVHKRFVNKDNCVRGQHKKIYNKFKHERLNNEIEKIVAEMPKREPRTSRFPERPQANPKEEWLTTERMSEVEAGITEFIAESKPFNALFKYRFSDFHVNEIDLDGNVAILTKLKVPRAPNPNYLTEEKKQAVKEEFGIEEATLEKMQMIADSDRTDEIVEFDVNDCDKDKRTRLHQFLKQTYKKDIVATTVEKDGKKYIKVFKYNNSKELIRERNNRWAWKDEYTHFILHKDNMDTIFATIMLAGKMRTLPSRFVYAGTKDRRAKTSQWMCARKLDPWRIFKAVENVDNVHVGNFVIKDHPLKLGHNKGNVFKIALKQIEADQEMIEKTLISIKENGFINYYGLQRFGNCATVPTYLVGIQLLKNNYKGACDLILQKRDGEPWYMKEMRNIWHDTQDPKLALSRLLNTNNCIEARILRGLLKAGKNNYFGALESVPRNMRLLYLHAYQSYVWNQVVSRRISKYGLKLIEGDLVYVDNELGSVSEVNEDLEFEAVADGNVADDENSEDTKNKATKAENGEVKSEVKSEQSPDLEKPGVKEDSAKAKDPVKTEASKTPEKSENLEKTEDSEKMEEEDESEVPESRFKSLVKPLTKEDIESGKYSVYDIVLPLPGHDITFPHNDLGDAYHEIMEKDGVSLDDMKNKAKIYSLTGAYRKVFTKPENFSWKFKKHNNLNDSLILSDIEKLKGEPEPQDVPENEDSLTALILEFSLPTSVYATMLLRELMKVDTSVATQLILTKKAAKDRAAREAAKEESTENGANEDEKPIKMETDDVKPANGLKLEEESEITSDPVNIEEQSAVVSESAKSEGSVAEKRKIEDETAEVHTKKAKTEV